MKLVSRSSVAVAVGLIAVVAAATMASSHGVAPTTSASAAPNSTGTGNKKVVVSGTYSPNNSECDQANRNVSIQLYKNGTATGSPLSTTTNAAGFYTATSGNLASGQWTATVTVTGFLFAGYDNTHSCPNGTAGPTNAVTIT